MVCSVGIFLIYFDCTKLHYFNLNFLKFSGKGLTESLPRPLPRFISGFALDTRALCALHSSHIIEFLALLANTISDATAYMFDCFEMHTFNNNNNNNNKTIFEGRNMA